MFCVLSTLHAQEDADDTEAEAEEGIVSPSSSEEPAGGDVLLLKSGGKIEGFQILRATHRHFILEGLYDPETDETLEIKVTRSQVKEVIYDDIDPVAAREEAKRRALERAQTTVQGARLTDRLYGLLEKVIGDPPLATDGLSLPQVLDELNKRVDNVIQVAEGVRKPERPWKGAVEPDMTLAKFLESQVTPNYPGLEVVFLEDAVQIKRKAAPAAAGAGDQADGGGAPAAPGGARAGRGGGPPPALLPGARGGAPPS